MYTRERNTSVNLGRGMQLCYVTACWPTYMTAAVLSLIFARASTDACSKPTPKSQVQNVLLELLPCSYTHVPAEGNVKVNHSTRCTHHNQCQPPALANTGLTFVWSISYRSVCPPLSITRRLGLPWGGVKTIAEALKQQRGDSDCIYWGDIPMF